MLEWCMKPAVYTPWLLSFLLTPFNGTSTFMSVNRGENRNHIRRPDADEKIFVFTNSYRALFVTRPVSGVSVG